MAQSEVYKVAFTEPMGPSVAGLPTATLKLSSPYVSYGLPYQEACVKHVRETYKASKVYIIASGTLSRESDRVQVLIDAIGKDNVVGVKPGKQRIPMGANACVTIPLSSRDDTSHPILTNPADHRRSRRC